MMHIWCLKVGALTGRGLGSTTLVCLVRINKEWPLFTGPTHLFSVQVSFHPSSTFPFNPQRKLCGSRAVSHEKDNTCIDVVTNDGATNIAESTKAIIRSQSRLHRCDSRLWEMNIGPNTKRRNKSIRRNQKTKNCFEKNKKKTGKDSSIRRTQLRFYVFGLYLNAFQLATNSPRYVRVAAIKRPYTIMQVDRHHRQNGCGLWGALRRVANSASFCWTTTTGEGLYIITWIEAHDVDAGHVTTAWKGSRYWTAPLLLWSSPSCEQQQDEDGMQVDQSSVRRRSCELFVRRYWSICLIYRMMEKVIQRPRPANQMHPKDLRRKRYSVQQANQRVSKRGTRRSP